MHRLDFREYFRQPATSVTALTPATKALFIAMLLRREWQVEWQAAEVITALGCTAMTLPMVKGLDLFREHFAPSPISMC